MTAERRTRILIVDDSFVIRSLLRAVICRDQRLEVAGTAPDGASALGCLDSTSPDLILLDVEMPVMDGLVTLKQLRSRGYKIPVIMCSSLTQRGAQVTIEALASGATDYVAKPHGQPGREEAVQALAEDLIPKIHALTGHVHAQPQPAAPGARRPVLFPLAGPPGSPNKPQPFDSTPAVLAIGVSTGGPAALDMLLPQLPASFPLPVLIVQHMPELFTRLLAERLNSRCPLRVCEAAEGVPVVAGSVYIARGDWHMEVLPAAGSSARPALHLTQGPLENHCRPAVDVLFRSAARVYGSGVLALVLTGMGSDGLNGCRIVRQQGGGVLAQDQASSTVWGMPGAVANAGLAYRILPLNALAPEILRITSRTAAPGELHETKRMAV
jgi:two-component system chemotaxis response regulator CheB